MKSEPAAAPDRRERAQGMVEYALIIGLIVLLCVVAVTTWGNSVSTLYSTINNAL